MKWIKYFEDENKNSNKKVLDTKYLEENYPIILDKSYLSVLNKIRYYIMIDDKPYFFSESSGLNNTKLALYRELKYDGFISDNRIDIPIIKKYLRSVLNGKARN